MSESTLVRYRHDAYFVAIITAVIISTWADVKNIGIIALKANQATTSITKHIDLDAHSGARERLAVVEFQLSLLTKTNKAILENGKRQTRLLREIKAGKSLK